MSTTSTRRRRTGPSSRLRRLLGWGLWQTRSCSRLADSQGPQANSRRKTLPVHQHGISHEAPRFQDRLRGTQHFLVRLVCQESCQGLCHLLLLLHPRPVHTGKRKLQHGPQQPPNHPTPPPAPKKQLQMNPTPGSPPTSPNPGNPPRRKAAAERHSGRQGERVQSQAVAWHLAHLAHLALPRKIEHGRTWEDSTLLGISGQKGLVF